jgi:hypothetical protein
MIGTLKEKSLHAAIKTWCGRPGDKFETEVDGFVIDIVRGDKLLEIQTGNFANMKRKLTALLENHVVHLIYPVPKEKWIVRQSASGQPLKRRRSPKRGQVIDVFDELIHIPGLLGHPNLTVEVLLTRQEEVLRDDGKGSWRRKFWSLHDYHLLEVLQSVTFRSLADFIQLLPPALPPEFTNRELATALNCRLRLAQKITYTLRIAGGLQPAGKRGRALLFKISSPSEVYLD